jgi:hypothetical protein
LLLVVAAAAWCVAYCLGTVHQWPTMAAADRAGFDGTQDSVLGLALLGQLVIVVFGTLMITSEYTTGMIRTSLTVMPRRPVLYWSKLGVFAGISLVLSLVTSFGVFFLGKDLLGPTHTSMSLSDPAQLRSVIVAALYVEACGLFAYGVGGHRQEHGRRPDPGVWHAHPAAATAQGAAWLAQPRACPLGPRRRHPLAGCGGDQAALLVDLAVVPSAQADHVFQFGFAAVAPVLDVVQVDPAGIAARVPAPGPVALVDRAA